MALWYDQAAAQQAMTTVVVELSVGNQASFNIRWYQTNTLADCRADKCIRMYQQWRSDPAERRSECHNQIEHSSVIYLKSWVVP